MCAGFGVGDGMQKLMPKTKLYKFKPNRDIDGNGNTNGTRAERAMRAVTSYIGEDRPDETPETHIQDMLCDLHHLCDREKIDISELIRVVRATYEDER